MVFSSRAESSRFIPFHTSTMSSDHDANNKRPAADNEDKIVSSQHLIEESNSSPQIENQLLQPHPDDVSSYDIETMRRIIFDMMQDLGTGIDIDSIESSFSKITSHQPLSMPKSYPNHVSSAQHPSIETDLKLQVRPVSSCFSRRSSSIPLFIKCNGKDSSIMMEEANDDDDVLSAGHSSVVHADAGCEVTSVDLQQMVNHIRSSAPDQFVNHCLQEQQRRGEAKSSMYRTSFVTMTPNDEAMMQSSMRRRVSDQMTMHRTSYITNPRSNFCSDPNSMAYHQEIEPLPFPR